MSKQSLLIMRAIFGRDAIKAELEHSLDCEGVSYWLLRNLDFAEVVLEQVLGMYRIPVGIAHRTYVLQVSLPI